MAKLRFDNENEAAWPDEDSATCQSLIEKGRALGVNFKSGTNANRSEDFFAWFVHGKQDSDFG
jgi:hypothetical protein